MITAHFASNDEEQKRGDHPSASGLERLVLCPGSWHMRHSGNGDGSSDDAEHGTEVHKYIAADGYGAPEELYEEVQSHIDVEEDVIERWKEPGEVGVVGREQRIWLCHNKTPFFSGVPDYFVIQGERALVIDHKTLGGHHPHVATNKQLRALAALLWVATGRTVNEVSVAIVQPMDTRKPDLCVYNTYALQKALDSVVVTVGYARTEGSKTDLNPGEVQCKYCPSALNCPAALTNYQMVAEQPNDRDFAPVPTPQLVQLLDRCGAAEKMIGKIRAEARRRLENGEGVEGWELKPGAKRLKVTDPDGAYAALADQMSAAQFTKCCDVKMGELKTAFYKASEIRPKKASDDELKRRLVGKVEAKQNKPTLARV